MTPPPRGQARRRPEVALAAEQLLLPLRPLTVGEVLDIAFWVVVRRARELAGLPLLVALGQGGYVLLVVLVHQQLVGALGGLVAGLVTTGLVLLGLALVAVVTVRLSASVSRRVLLTVLGAGFAPDRRPARRPRLLAGSALFALLAVVVLGVIGWFTSVAGYATLLPLTFGLVGLGAGDVVTGVLIAVLGGALLLALTCWGWSYVLLALPAWACESASAPSWIGRPWRPTGVAGAFGRAVQLVGWRQVPRAVLLTLAVVTGLLLGLLGAQGALGLLLVVYGEALPAIVDVGALLDSPASGYAAAVLLGVWAATLVPFATAAQTVFYLDLRMRREGLDSAMRFDCVTVPQPGRTPR